MPPQEPKECQVRWKEGYMPVVCGHPLPCPHHQEPKCNQENCTAKDDMLPHTHSEEPKESIESFVDVKMKEYDRIVREWDEHRLFNSCPICESPTGHTDIRGFVFQAISTAVEEAKRDCESYQKEASYAHDATVASEAVAQREKELREKIEPLLEEIGIGEYNREPLEHAKNVIRLAVENAEKVLSLIRKH